MVPTEKYFIDIKSGGSKGLTILDHLFNHTTQSFIINSNINQAKHVLDIGCGSGVMTCWLAKHIHPEGKVIAIENDENQLNAAAKLAEENNISNIDFKICSAYDIEQLNQKFDIIYCRFVLHHLFKPLDVINKIYSILNPKGSYLAEEGIVNFAFSYPFSNAWGNESTRLPPVWQDLTTNERDGNFGVKLITNMKSIGFHLSHSAIIHPLLHTYAEKNLLLSGRDEQKQYYLSSGKSEKQWEADNKALDELIKNENQIIGYYASCQARGIKL